MSSKNDLNNQSVQYDIVRFVTAPEVVSFHLKDVLSKIGSYYKVAVVGDNVEQFQGLYSNIDFYNIKIARQISVVQDIKALLQIIAFIKKTKPKITHSIMPKAGLLTAMAAYICRVPCRVHTFTGQVWATKTGLFRLFLKKLDQVVVLLNTHTFTDSLSQSLFLQSEGVSKNNQPLPVLGFGSLAGVNYTKFDPQKYVDFKKDLLLRNNIQPNEYVFLFIGRKCKDKGVFELIEAFNQIDQNQYPCRLLMVGPNEDTDYAEKIKSFNHTIIEIGKVSDPERYFASANAFCLFSYREGFGTVAIEAAAAHLPVLGSRIPGLVDAIADTETGYLVDVKSVKAAYEAMLKLVSNKELSKTLGEKGYQRVVEKFSSEKVFKFLLDFYQQNI